MQLTRRTLFGVTTATALGLTVAGCTKSSSSKTGGDASKTKGEAVGISENDINPKKRDEVADGGVMRLALQTLPANYNPFTLEGNTNETTTVMEALYPGLFEITADVKANPNPNYTKSVKIVSENPFVVQLELNEGMKWSDGTPLDYKSIANYLDVLTGKKGEEYKSLGGDAYEKIESYKQGANDREIEVKFKEPYADWFTIFSVAPDQLVSSAQEWNSGWVEGPKVTCGPFKVGKLDKANQSITLERDDNFHGDKAKLDQVLFTAIGDSSASATAYKNGQIDTLETSAPAMYTVVKDLIGKGSALRKAAGTTWLQFTFNGAEGRPLADQKLRQAMFHLFDRPELFMTVNGVMPYPKDTKPLENRLLMPNQAGYEDTSKGRGNYDVEAAKKILTEAGYTFDDKGMASKDGKPVEIKLVYNDGSSITNAMLPGMTESLAKGGVKLVPFKVPNADFVSKYVIPGEFDMVMFYWGGGAQLTSSNEIFKTDGSQNLTKVGNKTIDDALTKVGTETDYDKRTALLNQADSELWELASMLPMWQLYTFQVQNPDLANYGAFGFESVNWSNVGWVNGSDRAKTK